jgi:hypothetical protein
MVFFGRFHLIYLISYFSILWPCIIETWFVLEKNDQTEYIRSKKRMGIEIDAHQDIYNRWDH